MTRDKILTIIERAGEFYIPWGYRYDDVRNMCEKMREDDILERISSKKGVDTYVKKEQTHTNVDGFVQFTNQK